jgi:dihydropyrimidinase
MSAATHHSAVDYNPYEGRVVRGAPRLVMARGDVVFRDGEIVSSPGRGRYVPRECTSELLAGEGR